MYQNLKSDNIVENNQNGLVKQKEMIKVQDNFFLKKIFRILI